LIGVIYPKKSMLLTDKQAIYDLFFNEYSALKNNPLQLIDIKGYMLFLNKKVEQQKYYIR